MSNTIMMNVEDIKSLTAISENVDVDLLQPFIYNAQILYIKPLLGQSLYDDILSCIDSGSTKYDTLLTDYVYYALAYYTWYNSSIFMHVKTQKKGLVLQASDNSTNIDMETFSAYSKRIESMAASYADMLVDYLNLNQDTYVLYRRNMETSGSHGHSIFLPKNSNRKTYDPNQGRYI